MNEIIPFGKYKGQPLEVLQNDKKYLDWLVVQDWFKNQYQSLNQIIINNFNEPSETPEHNKLQTLFIDDEFCLKILKPFLNQQPLAFIQTRLNENDSIFAENKIKADSYEFYVSEKEFENGADVSITISIKNIGIKQTSFDEIEKEIELKSYYKNKKYSHRVFSDYWQSFLIEIKPSISDDYPAVIRQIRNLGQSSYLGSTIKILVAGYFTAKGATKEQFMKMCSFPVVFLEDVK